MLAFRTLRRSRTWQSSERWAFLARTLKRRWRACTAAAVLLVWVALTLLTLVYHEPWRDEADPWLVARDRSLSEVVQLAPYVGTPVLWTLSLVPLAKSGLPYWSMGVWCWVLGVAATAVLLFRAPWPLPLSTLLVFSYLLSYEYPIIARNYQLGVLLLLAALACHLAVRQRPALAGLLLAAAANTCMHCLILAFALAVAWMVDWWSSKSVAWRGTLGHLLAFGGVAVAVAQVAVQPEDGQAAAAGVLWTPQWHVLTPVLTQSWLPFRQGPGWLAVALLCQSAVYVAVWSHRAARLFLLVSHAGLGMLFVLVYAGGVRHWGFVWFASLLALWLQMAAAKPPAQRKLRQVHVALMGVAAAACFSVATAVWAWSREVAFDFSGSRATAHFLLENELDGEVIAGHPAEMAEAVLPHLAVPQFFYPARSEWGSHMWWDAKMLRGRLISEEELFARLERAFSAERPLLLLTTRQLPGAAAHGFVQLFESPPTVVVDEQFRVYGRHLFPRGTRVAKGGR